MQEIELRFLVPKARLKGLMRQVKIKSSKTTPMSAHYFDTPKQDLAKHGIGLRIRREGGTWVQTIKAGGDGIAARLEHNMVLDHEQVEEMLKNDRLLPDVSIYKETVIAPALADVKLKKLTQSLSCQYVTDVERTTRLLTDNNKETNNSQQQTTSTIEVAYDYGKIIDGSDASNTHSIHEIEFELIAGDVDFLFAAAKVWCKRYKLCLSTITKAERGGLLIGGLDYSPAVKANIKQLNITDNISMPAFMRALVHNCLLHILPNSSAIAAGSEDNEHVLQLRIGLQRLCVILKTFKKFSAQLNSEWLPILKQTATLLDDDHKLSYLSTQIESKLQQAGAPTVDWSADRHSIKVKPIDAVRANDFQLALLELIAFTMSDAGGDIKADKPAKDKLAKRLSKQRLKLLEAVHHYADSQTDYKNRMTQDKINDTNKVDRGGDMKDNTATPHNLKPTAQHKLHQQIKKMRYISELTAPLYAKKHSKRWLKRLKKAQKALGTSIDHRQYQQYYQQKSNSDINALYGAGWFAAHRNTDNKRCQKRLDKLQALDSFW